MKTYISILRGINVSGHRMIKMQALCAMYEKLNLQNVKSYIQSGNIVFQSTSKDCQQLEELIANQIATEFAFDVPVLVKSIEEWSQIINLNPFRQDKEPSHLHITFLKSEPSKENIDKITAAQFSPDEFQLIGKTIYLYCPNGYGNTKLNNTFFENKLKVSASTRNWRTTQHLLEMGKQ